MKKILCAVLALAAMASCSKEYIVAENKQAIAFGEAFVENSTRAAIDNTYLAGKDVESFRVWGTVQGTHDESEAVYIFPGTVVSRPDDLNGYNDEVAWVCNNVQYWVPNANYNFIAVVDGELNTTNNTIAYTVANQKDLLLATATASVDDDGDVTGDVTDEDGLVAFSFKHLLSKAYFTFKTDLFQTDAYSYEISNIQFDNAYTEGTYTVGGDWSATTTDALSFGATVAHQPSMTAEVTTTSQYVKVFIPQENVTVSFTVTIKFGGKAISVKDYDFTVFTSGASEAGHSYNFVAELKENATINFTVTDVKEWVDEGNIDLQ